MLLGARPANVISIIAHTCSGTLLFGRTSSCWKSGSRRAMYCCMVSAGFRQIPGSYKPFRKAFRTSSLTRAGTSEALFSLGVSNNSLIPSSVGSPFSFFVFSLSCPSFRTASYAAPGTPARRWTAAASWRFGCRSQRSHHLSQYSSDRSLSPLYCGTPYRSASKRLVKGIVVLDAVGGAPEVAKATAGAMPSRNAPSTSSTKEKALSSALLLPTAAPGSSWTEPAPPTNKIHTTARWRHGAF